MSWGTAHTELLFQLATRPDIDWFSTYIGMTLGFGVWSLADDLACYPAIVNFRPFSPRNPSIRSMLKPIS